MENDNRYDHTTPQPLGLKDQGLRWMKFINQGIPEVITPENFPGLPSRDIALGQFAARSSVINQFARTAYDQTHPDHLLYRGLLTNQTNIRDQELRVFIQTRAKDAPRPTTEPEQNHKMELSPVEQADMLVIFRDCGFTNLITTTLFPDIEEQNIDLARLAARSNVINRLEFNETITEDGTLKTWFSTEMGGELKLLEGEKERLKAKYSEREIELEDSNASYPKGTPDKMTGGYL